MRKMRKILLSISILFAMSANAQLLDCSELFISEYIEGPGNNNAIEIYNPTNTSIDLTGYSINRYGNGATTGPDTWPLSGNLAPGQAIAIGNGQLDSVWVDPPGYWSLPIDPVFYNACGLHGSGIYPTPFYFNGDDAMTLEKGANIIDIFGKVGEDPGNAWTDDASAGYTDANGGTWWSKRQTLVRKASVKKGITLNPIVFNPTLEYDSLPDGTYSGMGTHSCDCSISTINEKNDASYVMYPNPVNIGGTVIISSNTKIEKITLVNILGEVVLFSSDNIISTNILSKGTYIVNIQFTNGKIAENKLVIK
ncbi:MAG TPA: T9SS type A sorting domain-containing protein [Flavobacteriales bacterium]|nr:T9SS type A sorting domain-containing protein [Flavobacteriales bacterium]